MFYISNLTPNNLSYFFCYFALESAEHWFKSGKIQHQKVWRKALCHLCSIRGQLRYLNWLTMTYVGSQQLTWAKQIKSWALTLIDKSPLPKEFCVNFPARCFETSTWKGKRANKKRLGNTSQNIVFPILSRL